MLERGDVSRRSCMPRTRRDAEDDDCTPTSHGSTTTERAGVPIALKDVIGTKGIETTAGSNILAGLRPGLRLDRCRARAKTRGLSLLGKTNTDEFAMGSSTENSAFGPSFNPWDPDARPGRLGRRLGGRRVWGLAPWALGSDTGGSIKQPAALCGIVGLRPTYGTVSRYGIVAFASSLDQVGPTAKTVRDAALLYRIIAGRDVSTRRRSTSRRSSCRRRRTCGACASASRKSSTRLRGSSRAWPRLCAGRSICARSSAPGSRSARSRARSSTAWRATTSSRRRRHPRISRGTTASATATAPTSRTISPRSTSERATRASATSRSAGSCSERTRCRPATTKRSTARRRRCGR